MKWSSILHGISAVAGVLGVLSLFGAWIVGADGTILGLSQEHLFNDTNALLLTAVAFGIGTLIHQRQERQ